MHEIVYKFINLYKEGLKTDSIAKELDVENLDGIIKHIKETERSSGAYNKTFEDMVVTRVTNGLSKSTVSRELKISNNTVVKFCNNANIMGEQVQVHDKLYTELDVEYTEGECPLCHSKRFNHVSLHSHYCMDCGNEFHIMINCVKKLNFEFL